MLASPSITLRLTTPAAVGLVAILAGCEPTQAVLIDETPVNSGEGWVDDVPTGADPDDPEPEDWAIYEDATFRIVSPEPGGFRAFGEARPYEAELLAADGTPLSVERIEWSSNVDPGWDGLGLFFEDDGIDVGVHDITATAYLPNGDVLSYTSGGVRVQHPLAGTFSGLFTASGGYQQFQFTCSGSALIQVDVYGEVAAGNGDCVASLILFDLPLDFVFDLEVDPGNGSLTGQAGAAILGPITYDFPADGSMEPTAMDLAWSGTGLRLNFDVDAELSAERISRDPLE